jgi:hypothetical protein
MAGEVDLSPKEPEGGNKAAKQTYTKKQEGGFKDNKTDQPADPSEFGKLTHMAGYDHLLKGRPDQLSLEDMFKVWQILNYGKDADRAEDCILRIMIEAEIVEDQKTITWAKQWHDRIRANKRLALEFFEELDKEPTRKPMLETDEAIALSQAYYATRKGTQYQQQAGTILKQIIGQILRGDRSEQRLDQARAMLKNVNTDPVFAKQFVEEVQKTQPALQQQKKHFWQR